MVKRSDEKCAVSKSDIKRNWVCEEENVAEVMLDQRRKLLQQKGYNIKRKPGSTQRNEESFNN